MIANQDKLDSISNNIANINTDGYKRVDVSFKDLVYETLDRTGYPVSGSNTSAEASTGTGVRTSQWLRDYRQGNLTETKKITDLAIDGEGFFRVTMPNGEVAYSRSGKLDVDSMGRIVDNKGNFLEIQFNEGYSKDNVVFSKDNFSVNEFGNIVVQQGAGYAEVGKIPVFTSNGTNSFRSIGESLFVPVEGIEVYESTKSSILQGFLENSNVDLITEMTEMLMTQRAFELGSRGIKTADEMWGMANNLRGK